MSTTRNGEAIDTFCAGTLGQTLLAKYRIYDLTPDFRSTEHVIIVDNE